MSISLATLDRILGRLSTNYVYFGREIEEHSVFAMNIEFYLRSKHDVKNSSHNHKFKKKMFSFE